MTGILAFLALLLLSPDPLTAAPETSVKVKGDRTVVKDKSKPVRHAIEEWYDRNKAAFAAKDVAAIMSLRTPDFHTLTPDGKTNTFADMEARTQGFLAPIDHFVSQDIEIGTIEVEGDLASADVHQRTVRMQRLPGGDALHEVDSSVVQRETWKLTTEGWKLYRVDRIRKGETLVDGKPRPPAS